MTEETKKLLITLTIVMFCLLVSGLVTYLFISPTGAPSGVYLNPDDVENYDVHGKMYLYEMKNGEKNISIDLVGDKKETIDFEVYYFNSLRVS